MELFQLLQLNWAYFLAYDNWVEVILYTLVLVFMTTLGETCICAHSWQWQIGALTIFLAWIHLSIFIRKLPLFGLYIVMFQSIVWTFVRIAIPAFLLVLAFTMSFYMLFFVPNPLYAVSQPAQLLPSDYDPPSLPPSLPLPPLHPPPPSSRPPPLPLLASPSSKP